MKIADATSDRWNEMEKSPNSITTADLNNFTDNMPYGRRRTAETITSLQNIAQAKLQKQCNKAPIVSQRDAIKYLRLFKDIDDVLAKLYLTSTITNHMLALETAGNREYEALHAKTTQLIQTYGAYHPDVQQCYDELLQIRDRTHRQRKNELLMMLLPVYKILRKMGYSHQDLVD